MAKKTGKYGKEQLESVLYKKKNEQTGSANEKEKLVQKKVLDYLSRGPSEVQVSKSNIEMQLNEYFNAKKIVSKEGSMQKGILTPNKRSVIMKKSLTNQEEQSTGLPFKGKDEVRMTELFINELAKETTIARNEKERLLQLKARQKVKEEQMLKALKTTIADSKVKAVEKKKEEARKLEMATKVSRRKLDPTELQKRLDMLATTDPQSYILLQKAKDMIMSKTQKQRDAEKVISRRLDDLNKEMAEIAKHNPKKFAVLRKAKEFLIQQKVEENLSKMIACQRVLKSLPPDHIAYKLSKKYMNSMKKHIQTAALNDPEKLEVLKKTKEFLKDFNKDEYMDKRVEEILEIEPHMSLVLEKVKALIKMKQNEEQEQTIKHNFLKLYPEKYQLKKSIKDFIARKRRKEYLVDRNRRKQRLLKKLNEYCNEREAVMALDKDPATIQEMKWDLLRSKMREYLLEKKGVEHKLQKAVSKHLDERKLKYFNAKNIVRKFLLKKKIKEELAKSKERNFGPRLTCRLLTMKKIDQYLKLKKQSTKYLKDKEHIVKQLKALRKRQRELPEMSRKEFLEKKEEAKQEKLGRRKVGKKKRKQLRKAVLSAEKSLELLSANELDNIVFKLRNRKLFPKEVIEEILSTKAVKQIIATMPGYDGDDSMNEHLEKSTEDEPTNKDSKGKDSKKKSSKQDISDHDKKKSTKKAIKKRKGGDKDAKENSQNQEKDLKKEGLRVNGTPDKKANVDRGLDKPARYNDKVHSKTTTSEEKSVASDQLNEGTSNGRRQEKEKVVIPSNKFRELYPDFENQFCKTFDTDSISSKISNIEPVEKREGSRASSARKTIDTISSGESAASYYSSQSTESSK